MINILPRGTVLPILKGPLRGKKWVVRSSFQSCWLGVYEYEKQQEFIRTVKSGDVVYDIGAGVVRENCSMPSYQACNAERILQGRTAFCRPNAAFAGYSGAPEPKRKPRRKPQY